MRERRKCSSRTREGESFVSGLQLNEPAFVEKGGLVLRKERGAERRA